MRKIGFDLDNTIIDYTASIKKYCLLKNIPYQNSLNSLRKLLKRHEDDQKSWIEAQSWIYGPGLTEARLAKNFLILCNKLVESKFEIAVFSHKTEFGPNEFGSQPFRQLATSWISNSSANRYLLPGQNIHFFNNLDDKIRGINEYSPDLYVDDLIKVFDHPNYNREIGSFLYGDLDTKYDWLKSIEDFIELEKYL